MKIRETYFGHIRNAPNGVHNRAAASSSIPFGDAYVAYICVEINKRTLYATEVISADMVHNANDNIYTYVMRRLQDKILEEIRKLLFAS